MPSLQVKTDTGWLDITGGGSSEPPVVVEPYVRPADWLALPTLTVGQQEVVGLVAVFDNDANFISFVAANSYTVDWGDGTAPQNLATNAQAQHNYDFNALSSETLTSRGYRQAIITITPQGANNLATFTITGKHPQAGLTNGYNDGWLDIAIVGSFVVTLNLTSAANAVRHILLQQFTYVGPSAILIGATLNGCTALQSVVGTEWTAKMGNMTNLFMGCSSLATVPLFDTSNVTNMTGMFRACSSLATVPLFDTSNVTNMTYMLNNTSLTTVPLFDTSNVTNMMTMFSTCISLVTVPLFNTSKVTTMNSMFSGCSSLLNVPLFNTSAVLSMISMFANCWALTAVPAFDTSAVVTAANLGSMFVTCISLSVGVLSGTQVAISYTACKLSAAQIDAIFTGLASGVVSKTITVSNNWGYAACTPSIATAKGWTVA